jgi:c-di-GMP-binding flagellar brake protein YcgR
VGLKHGKFLLIDNPLVNGNPYFNTDDKVIIRYLGDGTVFGFESRIISVTDIPCTMAYISYPNSIEEKSLRRSTRINTFLMGKVTFSEANVLGSGKPKKRESLILDLSIQGCMISVSEQFQEGHQVQIEFNLPNGKLVQIHDCVIRRVEKNKIDYFYGIEFINIDMQTSSVIEDFVKLCKVYSNK